MDFFLSDTEIADLISEAKIISVPISQLASLTKIKRGHRENDLDIPRSDGSCFKIVIRQSQFNVLDFSAILGYIPKGKSDVFLLRRYNGKSHEHSNRLEKEGPFYDFHIHTATERYQLAGPRPEFYAEVTNRYSDIYGAIACLVADCGIQSTSVQTQLFT